MNKLLFELGFEELPVNEIHVLKKIFSEKINEILNKKEIKSKTLFYITPRRLIFFMENFPEKTEEKKQIVKGPPENIFYKNGEITKQGIGFLKAKNVTEEKIKIENGFIFYENVVGGEDTIKIISDSIKDILRNIEFSKKMKWNDSGVLFSRPIRWILFLFNNKVIDFSFANINANNFTFSNRNAGNEKITINSIEEYFDKIKENFVIINFNERKEIIKQTIENEIKKLGYEIIFDEELLNEVTNLVEYPIILVGEYDNRFLNLPEPIIIAALKQHQRYFSLNKNNKLINKFIFVSNAPFANKEIVIKNNQRVLSARLEDAEFYYKQDIEKSLNDYEEELKSITFYENLGTIYEKVKRNSQIAQYIDNLLENKIEDFEEISLITKFDLASNMIRDGKEFTKLQGIIGYYYAKVKGIKENYAVVSKEHYLPKTNNDELPKSYIGTVFSIADKIDNICGGFIAGYKPTGNKDIMSIRRDTIALLYLLNEKQINIDIKQLIIKSLSIYNNNNGLNEILDFIKSRIENFYDYDIDLIRCVLYGNELNILDINKKLELLKEKKNNKDFRELVIGLKRASNILKNEKEFIRIKNIENQYEKALYEKGIEVEKQNTNFVKTKNFEKILDNLLVLKKYIDDFFDNVLVMDKDENNKKRRLAILNFIRNIFYVYGDFSKISFDE